MCPTSGGRSLEIPKVYAPTPPSINIEPRSPELSVYYTKCYELCHMLYNY